MHGERVGKSIKKIIQIGNSSGIILPTEYLRWRGLERGDKVELFYNNVVKIRPVDTRDILWELGEVSEDEEKRVIRELEAEEELEREDEDEGRGSC